MLVGRSLTTQVRKCCHLFYFIYFYPRTRGWVILLVSCFISYSSRNSIEWRPCVMWNCGLPVLSYFLLSEWESLDLLCLAVFSDSRIRYCVMLYLCFDWTLQLVLYMAELLVFPKMHSIDACTWSFCAETTYLKKCCKNQMRFPRRESVPERHFGSSSKHSE